MEEELESNSKEMNSNNIFSQDSLYDIKNTAKWTRFVSIIIFLVCIVIIIFALMIITAPNNVANEYLAKLTTGLRNFVAVMNIFSSIILLLPGIYLFVYSNRLKKYYKTNNIKMLEKSFSIQKKFWKYIGILTIIGLSFFVITIASLFAGLIAGLFV